VIFEWCNLRRHVVWCRLRTFLVSVQFLCLCFLDIIYVHLNKRLPFRTDIRFTCIILMFMYLIVNRCLHWYYTEANNKGNNLIIIITVIISSVNVKRLRRWEFFYYGTDILYLLYVYFLNMFSCVNWSILRRVDIKNHSYVEVFFWVPTTST